MGKVVRLPHGEPYEHDGTLEPKRQLMPREIDMIRDLERMIRLVREGRLDQLIVVGSDPMTGNYLTHVALDREIDPVGVFGMMGVLETVKVELSEMGAIAPSMMLDGSILDPWQEEESIE